MLFRSYLVTEKKYPASLIAVEKKITLNSLTKRADIVVYNIDAKPTIIVECKAPTIKITEDIFDQIARYNLKLNAQYLIVTNGLQHFICQIDAKNETYLFINDLPNWSN